MNVSTKKVAIIGLGKVGITAAYAMLLRNTADEIILVSRSAQKAEGEQLDLEHGLTFLENTHITSTDDFSKIEGANVIVITAGEAQKPGQTRLDLIGSNKKIIEELAESIRPYVQNSVVVLVSNPVDILTYHLSKLLGLPAGRVFGTGTMLDTARFRFHLGEFLHIHPRSIHAYILGEHGESSFPVLAHSSVGGQPLQDFPEFSEEKALDAYAKTKDAAAKIILAKGATYYAIGVVITQIVKMILRDQKSVLPVSVPIENYYGESNVSISIPCIIGKNGAEQILQIKLSAREQEQFKKSCSIIRQYL
ncbi:MAG: L-lactate dehydrogenase [Candidatus Woesebacteria bacterium]